MPKDTKTLGNNKAQACESLGFAKKKEDMSVLTHPHCILYVLILSLSRTHLSARELSSLSQANRGCCPQHLHTLVRRFSVLFSKL